MFVAGPVVRDAHIEARITVRKTGDPTARSKVRVYTLDGSAKAGKAYEPMTEVSKICSSPKMFFESEDRRRNWFAFTSLLVCVCFVRVRYDLRLGCIYNFVLRFLLFAFGSTSFCLCITIGLRSWHLHFDVRSV